MGSEVRLSKTRRYIKHREREFNEEFNWINVDFRNKMHDMSQSRRKLEQVNKYIADKHNELIGLNDVLKKNLSVAENKVISSQMNNNNINFVNNNARMLAETLQKERKSSSLKIDKLKGENLLYKIQIQDLEKEKGELTVNNNGENINLVMKNTMESLVKDVDSKKEILEHVTSKLEEKNVELREINKN